MLARLRDALRRRPAADEPPLTLAGHLRDLGTTVDAWAERWRNVRCVYVDLTDEQVATLADREPSRVLETFAVAEQICRHEFNLLGSGLFVPDDPDRPARDGYRPIDWYLDPVRQLRFPRGIPHKQWDLYAMRPGRADVKYPWELARCQHWAVLGQAYRLSGDDRFANEIAHELIDFVDANPVGVGINWTCTMDVALRAVSWTIGLALVRSSGALNAAFWAAAASALFDHGVFIRANLENTYEVTSNHFLSNVVGLWFLGAVFADTATGRDWIAFGRDALEREIDVQVLPDGADFESSIPYHRFVAELFLGAARLGDASLRPLSTHYRSRVRDMAAYLAAVLGPDGLMPQVGDADDGRLHVLTGYGATPPQDARHLLAAAGAIFGEPEWIDAAGRISAWESAWWGVAAEPHTSSVPPSPVSRLFRDAGTAVMRPPGGTSVLVTNGAVGTEGFGNHKHNDLLSFECHIGDVPFIVDPGSFVYTADPDARNLFRSTASHNTLRIDAAEQNDFKPEWLFRMFDTSRPEHVSFADSEGVVEYVGRHHGYDRLGDPVTHERAFRVTKSSGVLAIVDRLLGRGTHDLQWHFHLAPGVDAEVAERSIRLTARGRRCRLHVPEDLQVATAPAAYSPSYGVRIACTAINLTVRATISGERAWSFVIEPLVGGDARV